MLWKTTPLITVLVFATAPLAGQAADSPRDSTRHAIALEEIQVRALRGARLGGL